MAQGWRRMGWAAGLAGLICGACAGVPGLGDWGSGGGWGTPGAPAEPPGRKPDAPPTTAGSPPPVATTPPARGTRVFYWCATTDENELKWRSKVDWAQRVDFGGAPVRRDITIFYGQYLGKYPLQGLHQAQRPGWMDDHLRRVKQDVEARLPANFTGLACIDYENWSILWNRLVNVPSKEASPDAPDQDYKDDWREHLAAVTTGWDKLTTERREALAKATYDRAARDFFLRTLSACREARPRARWGFFDYPASMYGGNELPAGRTGYPEDGRGVAGERNDQLRWLYDAVDVVFPSVYCVAYTVPPGQKADWQQATNTVEQNREYTLGNVREAVRLARGKPVIAFMWPRYQRPGSKYDLQYLNEINLEQALELPFEAGADGVAVWESVKTAAEFGPLQEYITKELGPAIEKAARGGR